MKILISGSSGLIGSALTSALEADGHTLRALVRDSSPSDPSAIPWQPLGDSLIDEDRLEGLDVVIHLAGETINGRWTDKKKAAIRDSRIRGTGLLARSLARCQTKPRLLLSGQSRPRRSALRSRPTLRAGCQARSCRRAPPCRD